MAYLEFSGPVSFIHWPKLISPSSHSVVPHGCKEREKLIFRRVHIYYNGVGKCKFITKSLKYIKLKHNNAFRNITKAQHTPPEHFLCERFWKLNIWSIGQLNGKSRGCWVSLNCQRSFQHLNIFDKRYCLNKERRHSYHLSPSLSS